MSKIRLRKGQKGFTLVELMIASVVFSVILLAAATVLIQISRLYYKGVIVTKTQSVTRNTVNTISRGIQFSGADIQTPGATVNYNGIDVGAMCIGTNRYSYAINVQIDDGAPENSTVVDNKARHALWQDTIGQTDPCEPLNLTLAEPSVGGTELLEQHMRLTHFSIGQIINTDLYNIFIGTAYGDNDLIVFTDPVAQTGPERCTASPAGTQWCAFSAIQTQVQRRIEDN